MAQSKSNLSFTTKTTTPALGITPAPLSPYPRVNMQSAFSSVQQQPGLMSTPTTTAPKPVAPAPATQPAPVAPSRTQTLSNIQNQALSLQNQLQTGQVTGLTPAPQPQVQPFRGILDSLLGASRPTNDQERARAEMERIAAGNQAIGDEARRISEQYGSEIARIGKLGAGAVAGNLSTGTNVVGSGNAAIASQSASQRMNALAQGLDAELKGTGQQLTGQQQMADAFNPSLQATLTQQQQQIGGLSNAGGLAQPMQLPYSSGAFNPLTGEQIGGGFGGWAGYTTAQQVQSLLEQYPDAGVTYNPNLTPQQNLQMAQQAIAGAPSYQKNTYGVPGASSYPGASVLGSAREGFDTAYRTYEDINKFKTYADNIAGQLEQTMTNYGIGVNDIRKVNEVVNYLGRQFGEEGQAAFQTALAEAQRAYSTLLTIGGGTVPTEATAAANTILNPNSTIGQITAAIDQLKRAGEERLRTQGTQMSNFWNQLQSGSQSGGGSYGGNTFAEQW